MRGFALSCSARVVPLAALVLRPPPMPPAGSAARRRQVRPARRCSACRPNLAMAMMGLGIFLCCVPMAMPAAHLVAFCSDIGIVAQRGAMMVSVMLVAAFVARQVWGWLSDRVGGLKAVLAGNIAQVIGMSLFLVTQDEAGLFLVAAVYGFGFSGIIPSWMLAVRQLFPAQEASWRMPAVLFHGLSGMAFGAWLAGYLYDRFGNYAVAWEVGIALNLVQVVLVAALLCATCAAAPGLASRPPDAWRQAAAKAAPPRLTAAVRRSPASAQAFALPRVRERWLTRTRRCAGRRPRLITAGASAPRSAARPARMAARGECPLLLQRVFRKPCLRARRVGPHAQAAEREDGTGLPGQDRGAKGFMGAPERRSAHAGNAP